jgi:sugar lactone lactonase YvrE
MVSASGIITTVAGGATINFTGDGGPASASLLHMPQSVALDAAGNLYIADTVNSRVRKIDTHSIISTLAGNGAYMLSGDGGTALRASFYWPNSVVLDSSGNMYVSDSQANRVRKISPSGTITTVAGYSLGYAGDGGPATSALLNSPSQLALDSVGNLYIADAGNGRIRKVDVNGNISTVAGGGSNDPGEGGPATAAVLRYPGGVAVDAGGNLYIADALAGHVRKVDSSGTISTLGTYFQFPARIALDNAGRVYVSTEALSMGRRDGGVTRINADGTQTAAAGGFIDPFGLAFDSNGTLYVSEGFGGQVMRVGANLTNTVIAGTGIGGFSGDGGPAASAQLNDPQGLAFDATGALLVVDSGNARVRRIVGPSCTGAPEPQVQMNLPAGFYIAEVRNPSGTAQGYWGMTVNVNQGVVSGGFNLGGAIRENNGPPGYGAFYIPQSGPVTFQISAQVIPGGDPSQFKMNAHILDSNRQLVGAPQSGTTAIQFTPNLTPGFYILEVFTASGAPRATFQTSIITSSITGGVNAGGFVTDGIVGFGGFYVPQPQGVTLQLFGTSNGVNGAACVQLTLLDANRNIVTTAP